MQAIWKPGQEQKTSFENHEARENNFNRCGKAPYKQ